MPLKRTTTWDTGELSAFLRARALQPFEWGTNDCCLFPADAIEAMTGVDIAADFRIAAGARGNYHDAAGAFALIRTVTGSRATPETAVGDAAAWCAANHGLREWRDAYGSPMPLFARRGDLVVMQDAGRLIAGVVHLNGKHLVSVAESGLVRLPIQSAVRAWHVG